MTSPLTGKQRRYLRGLGHALKPVVQIGRAGLGGAVLKAIDQALHTHELIKVKVAADADDAETLVEPIETRTRARVAQVVGRTLLVYRGRKKDPAIVLPLADEPRRPQRPPGQTARRAAQQPGPSQE
jgi:RNA-binding protein